MDATKIIIKNVGQPVADILNKVGTSKLEQAKEIRLSVDRAVRIVYYNKSEFVGRNGRCCTGNKVNDCLTKNEIRETFASLCEYSVHTYQKDICEGFITIEGGIRVGICGTAVYDGDKIINIKDISSLNIRIAREIKGASDVIFEKIQDYMPMKLLIVGPPCSGKTTLLRDIARVLGNNGINTCIVDERMEIAGVYHGTAAFDIGDCTSVLNGFMKKDGIIRAVRSMAPEVIICDEFGGTDEIEASLYAMKSGTSIIASMHCLSIEELLSKREFECLKNSKIFKWIVLLGGVGNIKSVVKVSDLTL